MVHFCPHRLPGGEVRHPTRGDPRALGRTDRGDCPRRTAIPEGLLEGRLKFVLQRRVEAIVVALALMALLVGEVVGRISPAVLGLTGLNLATGGADQQEARADGRHHHQQAQPFPKHRLVVESRKHRFLLLCALIGWPWSSGRVGSCPTPLRGGLLGYVTIAPYSPNLASISLNCSIYYNFLCELLRTP